MPHYTLISGFNTHDRFPSRPKGRELTLEEEIEREADLAAYMKAHFVQTRRYGAWRRAAIRSLAARMGIVRGLAATATRFDTSGKGHHRAVVIISSTSAAAQKGKP